MKLLTVSACLLSLAALLIGFGGAHWLDRRWRELAQAEFSGVLNSLSPLVVTRTWQEPWEHDPNWQLLERQLNMELIPVEELPRSQVARDERTEAASLSPVQWHRTATGKESFTAVVQLGELGERAGPTALQVTRELPSNRLLSMWWLAWGALCSLAAMTLVCSLGVVKTQRRLLQGTLSPWLTALRGMPNRSRLLPPIDTESELEPALAIVSELVNQIVSDLHNINQRSELVLSNLQEGVLAIDERTHVLLANEALHHLLGLPKEPYWDRLLLEIVRVPQVNELAERVLKERKASESLLELSRPARTLRVLGRPLPLHILPDEGLAPSPEAAATLRVGALLTLRDETLLRRIEAVRRDFVANASHELKTPLAAIRAYAETLQLGALDDRPVAEQFVGNIIEQADRIDGLVQGMLQLSRVEASTALQFEWFEAQEAARPCIAASTAVARGKAIEISTEFPTQPLLVRCDRDGFQTILGNLLSNAVRYTHDHGAILVELKPQGNDYILRVSDEGIGIAPDDVERIFERFYRAAKDRSTQSGGTGLGLSIVKHLVQALGGTIQVSSQPGRGSSFEVCLPIEGR